MYYIIYLKVYESLVENFKSKGHTKCDLFIFKEKSTSLKCNLLSCSYKIF